MVGSLRQRLHPIIPSDLRDPVGLVVRILRSGGADGRFAILGAGLKVLAMPLDRVLAPAEARLRRDCNAPHRPVLIVTGPPRSGTTIVEQALLISLDVAYITNLMCLLPHAPIVAQRALGGSFVDRRLPLASCYGRTRSFHGPNDGLDLWDGWLGVGRTELPDRIAAAELRAFFGALQQTFDRPVVTKNNPLMGYAHLVAEALPTARFVCLRRHPLYLAQSMLMARRVLHGDTGLPYGIDDPDHRPVAPVDPIRDVCRQVAFFQRLERQQAERIGPDRFRVIDYEGFCAAPAATVRTLGRELLGLDADTGRLDQLGRLPTSQRRTLPVAEFARLEQELARLNQLEAA